MAHKLENAYSGRVNVGGDNYPFGSFKNATTPQTGTPLEEKFLNDLNALMQSVLLSGGITPNDATDTVLSSQYFQGLRSVSQQGSIGYDFSKAGTSDLRAFYFAEGEGKVVAVELMGRAGPTEQVSVTLDGGHSWTGSNPPGMAGSGCGGVAYGNGVFCIILGTVATTGSAWTSPDGVSWIERTGLPDNEDWESIVFDGTKFIALAQKALATSPDGIIWTPRTIQTTQEWAELSTGGGVTVAVASGGTGSRTMRSIDNGATWLPVTSGDDAKVWQTVTYGKGVFSALSSTGDVTYSEDLGASWTIGAISSSDDFRYSVFAGGRFIALSTGTGADDQIAVSSDGKYWTSVFGTPIDLDGGIFALNNGDMMCWQSNRAILSGS